MIKIYTCIVGDLFHYGHVNFLSQAKSLGDYLIVGICSDEDCIVYKRKPVMSYDERLAVIKSCKYIDEIIERPPSIIKNEFLEKYKIDILAHGDDSNVEQLNFFYKDAIDKGIYRSIPYTKSISTTEIIKRIKDRNDTDRKFFSGKISSHH